MFKFNENLKKRKIEFKKLEEKNLIRKSNFSKDFELSKESFLKKDKQNSERIKQLTSRYH